MHAVDSRSQTWAHNVSLWDVESTSKLDSKGVITPMGPNGPRFELIYLVGMDYDGQIDSKFTFVCKGVLVIMQGCTKIVNKVSGFELIE